MSCDFCQDTGIAGPDRTCPQCIGTPTRDMAQAVIDDIAARRQLGWHRYGKLVDPLDAHEDWHQHHYEELLDAVIYHRALRDRWQHLLASEADNTRLRRLVLIQADEIERLRELVRSEAERITAQSELLTRRAGK
jgi:hypothetical protein